MINKNTRWETCPACGQRERRSDCLLGGKCRKKYDEEVVLALVGGHQAVDMFDFAEANGRETLERLKEEWQEARDEKNRIHKSLWSRAAMQVQANLSSQTSSLHITEGIRHRATLNIFENLRDENRRYKGASRKVQSLRKAIESLQKYLAELPAKRQECQERIKAEQKTKAVPA